MSKKKKKSYNMDEEVIIGYNSKRKKDNPPKKKKRKWNKIKKVLLALLKIILILAVISGIIIFLFVSPVFNITEIRVENAQKISQNTYIALSEIHVGENIFKVSKSNVKDLIKTEAYVEEVEVKREYPGTIVLTVTERKPEYMTEKNGVYIYIDKNGYALEVNVVAIEKPILKGLLTDVKELDIGERINEEDLLKFNDLIKITDGIKNNNIEATLSNIDISDDTNYILEFQTENKKAMIGDTSDLSTKMLWIKYFMQERKGEAGVIHLNGESIYFAPSN